MLNASQYETGKTVVQNNYGIDRPKFIAEANAYLFAGTSDKIDPVDGREWLIGPDGVNPE